MSDGAKAFPRPAFDDLAGLRDLVFGKDNTVYITAQTKLELELLGVRLPKTIKIYKPGDPVDYVVAQLVDREHPINFFDNKLGECSLACGRKIQWRPHALPIKKICPICAAEMSKKQKH